MTASILQALIIETIRAPADAARRILALKLPQEWLWMALALMCVLNAFVYSVALHMSPPTDPSQAMFIPAAFRSPVLLTLFLFAVLSLTTIVLHRLGRYMDGAGELRDILALVSWLQVLRLVLQLVVVVLSLVAPAFGALLVLVASVWGIYIMAAFVNVAHGYDNIMKAAGVMLLSFLAIAIGMSILLGLIGPAFFGVSGHV